MPPSTVLLAGGRPAAIGPSAMPLQWTTAFSACATDGPIGPIARTATNVRAFDVLNVFVDFIVLLSLVFWFLFSQATSPWLVVSIIQGDFRHPIPPRV
jgi:hypothetical protein